MSTKLQRDFVSHDQKGDGRSDFVDNPTNDPTFPYCICCNKAGCIGIKVDIPIDNIIVKWIFFCNFCTNEPNIFLDHTPKDIFQGKAHPRTLTPNFTRYLLTKATDQTRVWKGFVK